MIKTNIEKVITSGETLESLSSKCVEINKMIDEKTGAGSDFLGWTTYADELGEDVVAKIEEVAAMVQKDCDTLVVIGIGGSYLGAKAAIHAIRGVVSKSDVDIVYLGNTISPTYTAQVVKSLKGKKIAINVISKSGTTTEPAIAFRLCLQLAKEVWGADYYKYVIATTDAAKGALHQIALQENYTTFVIPDNVGGRYSVFTPVGLVPMAVAGLDIRAFLNGTKEGIKEYSNPNLLENEAYKYALTRYLMKKQGLDVEFFVTYEFHLNMLAEWWKQLFGESEGKDGTGLLPASLCFSTDLHSMGQFCQEGSPIFFETTVKIDEYQDDIEIPYTEDNLDGLNYLAGKKMSFVNDVAMESTISAHYLEGKHTNIIIELDKMNEFNLGKLMYFFCKACAMSAYALEVNPFNQPGVEVYKAKMKTLLKKG